MAVSGGKDAEVEGGEWRGIDGRSISSRVVLQHESARKPALLLEPQMLHHRLADLAGDAQIRRAALLLVEEIGRVRPPPAARRTTAGAGEGEDALPLLPQVERSAAADRVTGSRNETRKSAGCTTRR